MASPLLGSLLGPTDCQPTDQLANLSISRISGPRSLDRKDVPAQLQKTTTLPSVSEMDPPTEIVARSRESTDNDQQKALDLLAQTNSVLDLDNILNFSRFEPTQQTVIPVKGRLKFNNFSKVRKYTGSEKRRDHGQAKKKNDSGVSQVDQP